MKEHMLLGGPRMDALAARFSDDFATAERAKVDPLVAAADVSPVELYGLLVRAAVSSLTSALTMIALETGVPLGAARDWAVAALDHQLRDAPRGRA
jgi:hypothetical protein